MKNTIMNRVALAIVGLCAVGIVAWMLSGRSMGTHRAAALPSAEIQELQSAVQAGVVPSVAQPQGVAPAAQSATAASVPERQDVAQTTDGEAASFAEQFPERNGWQPVRSLPKTSSAPSDEVVKVKVNRSGPSVLDLSYAMPAPVLTPWQFPQSAPGMAKDMDNVKLAALQAAREKEWHSISLGNAPRSGSIGAPVLPVVPTSLVLPAGRTVDKIEVVCGRKITLPGVYNIQPGQPPLPIMEGAKAEIAPPNRAIYEADKLYPEQAYESVGIQKKRGVSILVVNLKPVAYSPVSGQIEYYETLSLQVTTKPADETDGSGIRIRPDTLRPIEDKVDNPATLSLPDTGYTGSAPAPTSAPAPLGSLCNPADSFQYVMVTSAEIKNATTTPNARDLIARKQAAGVSATIVTIEDVLANYTGLDNQEKLRKFIIDAYNNWETDFVLLGGDINIIPMRKLYCEAWPRSNYIDEIPSDLYFQCLDGDYNSDGDNQWGEPNDGSNGKDVDLLAEVYVGRASAENAAEMANWIYKTLYYENSPADAPYLRNNVMVGERLGFGGVSEYAGPSLDEIVHGSTNHGYATVGFDAAGFNTDTLYAEAGEFSATAVKNAINSGKYSLLNHLGHANATYVMGLYNADADKFTNSNPFFAYSQGCIPGNFEVDCIGEHFTTSTRHGAFAVVFNARYGWGQGDSTDGGSERFHRQFWDAYFGEFMVNLGVVNADSHEDNIWGINQDCIRWCFYETNLQGDPQTPIMGRPAEPLILHDSVAVNDSAGNNDGLINPGETVSLNVTLRNVGINATSNVTAVLSENDAYVSVLDAAAAFGNMPGLAARKTALDPFVISIATNCPTPHDVTLNLRITDGAGRAWTNSFHVVVETSYQISGVATLDGAPASGVTIEYWGPKSGKRVTDASGAYLVTVTKGTTTLTALKDGWLAAKERRIVVPPSQSKINFAFTTAKVAGRVTDARTGVGMAGVTVAYGAAPSGSATTGTDGRYEFTRVYSQTTILTVTAKMTGFLDEVAQVAVPPNALSVNFALGFSDIDVAPTSLVVNATVGEVATQTLTIRNLGTKPLDWSINPFGREIRKLGAPDCYLYRNGVTFDGSALWVLDGGGWVDKLDAVTGKVINQLQIPRATNGIASEFKGLAWDGAHLWTTETILLKDGMVGPGTHMGQIHAVNPVNSEIIKTLQPHDALMLYGVMVADGYVWAAGRVSSTNVVYQIWKLDPSTGNVVATIPSVDQGGLQSGLECFNGALWRGRGNSPWTTPSITKQNMQTGAEIESYPAQYGDGHYVFDLAHAGGRMMWVLANNIMGGYAWGEAYLVDTGDELWVKAAQRSGTVAAGGTQQVTLSLNALAAGPGAHETTLRIVSNDPDELEALVPVSFTVAPNPNNHLPVIAEGASVNVTMSEDGKPTPFNLILHATDADNDTLVWSTVTPPNPGTVLAIGAGPTLSVNYRPIPNQSGTDRFVVQVSDGKGGTATITVNVTIVGVNEPPTVTWDADTTIGIAPFTVAFTAVGNDVDGDTLKYVWNFGDGSISTPQASGAVTHTYTGVGTFKAIVTVSDPSGSACQAIVPITVSTVADANGAVLHAWGLNSDNQLGCATIDTISRIPLQVPALYNVIAMGAPGYFSVALKSDGTVFAWGDNEYGQLGDGTRTDRRTPVQVTSVAGSMDIAAGVLHTLVLKNDRSVWAWGDNENGRLGDGTTETRTTPVPVSGITGVVAIAANYHSMAVKADGSVWTWGYNYNGQLGDGTTTDRIRPVKVSGLTNVAQVAGGIYHTLALRKDGSVWAWGANYNGQLGDGTLTRRLTPVRVKMADGTWLSGVIAISALGEHSIALKGDGSVWAWGRGKDGQLGNGAFDDAKTPVRVIMANGSPLSGVTRISAGANHSIALTGDGKVWTCGWNNYGQIGDGTAFNRKTATEINGLSGGLVVACGSYHTFAVTAGSAANQPPVITEGASAAVTMSEDGAPTAFGLTLHATDADANTLTWSISNQAAHGTATASGTGASKAIGYTPLANYFGNDSFVVTVSDGNGGTGTTIVNVTIQAVNDVPTCALTAPANGATYTVPASIVIQATASDVDGTIAKVEFFKGTTKLGEDTTSPYAYTWSSVATGSYTLTAKATDNSGATKTSAARSVTVTAASNQPPIITEGASVAVTMSEDGTPTAFSLTLHATDANTNTLTWSISTPAAHGTATASGTGLSKAVGYAPAANYNGTDSFAVTVSDGKGGTDSITVNVTIQAVNDAPSCALTSPANGATFAAPALITLQATGADSDGTIAKVEFFNGATKLGEDATSPYAYTWSGVAAGTYTLTVKATDNSGATKTSAAANITVTATANQPPVAMAGVNPTSGSVTNEFYFWGTDSYDPDGTIVAYEWRVAGALVSTNAEFLYTFATGGTYTVALTVRDNSGSVGAASASDSDAVVVNVSETVLPVVSVTASDAVAGEPGLADGTGKFIISRSGDLTQGFTVNYAMSGTSSNGVDYTKLSGAVSLAAGKASASVTLTPLPDALLEGDETAILTLLPGAGYAADGTKSAGTVTIKDQTYGKPVVTAVATDSMSAEPGLTVNKGAIKVSRTGSCDQALTVKATLGGTAVNGVDYTTVTVPVTLAVGQSSKVLTIAPLADGVVEP